MDHEYINLAEKLRQQFSHALLNGGNSGYYKTSNTYSTGNTNNGVSCTTECRFSPKFTARSQQEIDTIARDMTNQIVSELRSGKIVRSQLNQPNWFENRVQDRLSQVIHEHQAEFDRNQQAAANRFHQQQTQTQTHWNNNNLQQIHQPIFTQSQQQQQNNFYQQQSQSQQNIGYIRPVVSGNSFQKVTEQHHHTQSHNSAVPTLVTVNGPSILEQENCTTETGAVYPTFPTFNVQNQFNRIHNQHHQSTNNGGLVYVRPGGGGSTLQQTTTIHRTENRVPQQPIIIPTQNTFHREINQEHHEIRNQQRPIITIPTQNTFREVKEEHREEHRQQQPIIPIPTQNTFQHEIREENHEIRNQQRPIVTIPKQNTFRHEYEEHREIHNQQQPRPVVVPITQIHTEHHEVINRDESDEIVPNYRPRVVINANTEFEELEVKNQHRQQPVFIQPTISTHSVTKEEENINRQSNQRPIIVRYPQQTIVQNVEEEVHTLHHNNQPQPQFPVITHNTETHVVNKTTNNNGHTHTVITRPIPGGHSTTTIDETHYVHIVPQPATQYTIQYNEEEYLERLNRIQQELQRLGYGTLTEEEYNTTIGGFIHNGFKYLYNADRGRYEKTDRVEITEDEYYTQLRRLQNQLHQYGLHEMTEEEYNRTIDNGYFDQSGIRYVYDSENGHYYKQQMNDQQYLELRHNIQEEIHRIGWGDLTETELNQTIATGHIVINGHNYILNKETGHLEKGNRVEISEQEYRTILRRLQEQLYQLGFEQMTESEYNQTISTGHFVRGGNKYRYNSSIGVYEKVELTETEYDQIFNKLQETLKKMHYRQMSEHEVNQTIATGTFIRGGYQWTYNTETGETNAVRTSRPNEELTESEYRAIYNHLQSLITRIGYPKFTETEASEIIASGSFVKGGNEWTFKPEAGTFERIELSENERAYRVDRLIDILTRLNVQKDEGEIYEIINNGNFHFGGRIYEYDQASHQWVLVQMTEAEYRERVRQLLEQLARIGYGTMSESECRATINSGIFYYGGHEWVYNHASGIYEIGKASDKENGIIDDNHFNNIGFDRTQYGTSKNDTGHANNSFNIDNTNDPKNKRPREEISKDRGDQPPHVFIGDYDDSEEIVEPHKPLPPLPAPATTPRPIYQEIRQTVAPSEANQHIYQKQEQTQTIFPVPTPTQETYEHHYRKQTTYTGTVVFFE